MKHRFIIVTHWPHRQGGHTNFLKRRRIQITKYSLSIMNWAMMAVCSISSSLALFKLSISLIQSVFQITMEGIRMPPQAPSSLMITLSMSSSLLSMIIATATLCSPCCTPPSRKVPTLSFVERIDVAVGVNRELLPEKLITGLRILRIATREHRRPPGWSLHPRPWYPGRCNWQTRLTDPSPS